MSELTYHTANFFDSLLAIEIKRALIFRNNPVYLVYQY